MTPKQATEILKKEGLLPQYADADFKEFVAQRKGNILDFLTERGVAPTEKIIGALQGSNAARAIDLDQTEIDLATMQLLPASLYFEHLFLPFYQSGGRIFIAMADPGNEELIRFLEQKTGKEIVAYLAPQQAIKKALEAAFNSSAEDSRRHIVQLIQQSQQRFNRPETMARELPIIALVNHLILFGLRSQASDLHIEPRRDAVAIRFRIDGMLHDLFRLPTPLLAPIIARLKILSRLRIDEHQRALDGRFAFSEAGFNIAVRLSIVPTLYGQKAALRFLDTDGENLTLETLGVAPTELVELKKLLGLTSGLILVTGPTGSGKTTTMYALLRAIENNKVNISTIEDPIEYHLPRANQIQVNRQIEFGFAEGLRAILRQDPDIIMVGEIRDRETATIAINAALTGHLVISSLHTNSAAAAIPRLLDMGVEPFLIASTLRAVIGQRLLRRLCQSCKEQEQRTALPAIISPAKVEARQAVTVAVGRGCERCFQTGYQGRTGIFECLTVDERLHDLIMNRANAASIAAQAKRQGMKLLVEDGFDKALKQQTSLAELTRVIN